MNRWVYFATRARANEADTLRFALTANCIVRTARKSTGSLNANVPNLAAGDHVLLVYRGGRPVTARAKGTIAAVQRPVLGTRVIESITGPLCPRAGPRGLHAARPRSS